MPGNRYLHCKPGVYRRFRGREEEDVVWDRDDIDTTDKEQVTVLLLLPAPGTHQLPSSFDSLVRGFPADTDVGLGLIIA